MRMLTGALVLIAGAIVYAGGVVAEAILCHRIGTRPATPEWAIGLGIVLGLLGLGVLASGWRSEENRPKQPPTST